MDDLKGVIPSFLTPLNEDMSLDAGGVEKEVNYLLEAGAKTLWLAGTGGEIHAISEQTLLNLVKEVQKHTDGKVPVMANISACGTQISIDRAKKFRDCGVTVAACTPPFYFSYGQEEVLSYYISIAKNSPLPVIIYNNPFAGSRFDVTPEMAVSLCDEENIIGIKDCSGIKGRIEELIKVRTVRNRKDFLIYESWEPYVANSLFQGADGAIMSAATVLPKLCIELYDEFLKGNADLVHNLQKKISSFLEAFMVDGVFPDHLFIGGTKACLELLGICSRRTVHPILPWPKEKDLGLSEMLAENNLII